jgi:hypothetical protein
MASISQRLEDLADDVTRRLGIPFRATSRGVVSFREPLRITSWSVPLVFDGHAAWDRGSLVPTDFVGHLLWANLKSTSGRDDPRPWWHCSLSESAAAALVGHFDDHEAGADTWVIGRDVLLEPPPAPKPTRRHRQVA